MSTRYKRLMPAKKFADNLRESEIYDTETCRYIYGTSQFVTQLLMKAKDDKNV